MSTGAGRKPTRGQLLAMAYVDGELTGPARLEFEKLQCREPALMREVVELRALELLLRKVAGPEHRHWMGPGRSAV